MTIYVVTSGEYSDYGIDEVFTDKKQAELYCVVHKGCRIEKYKADPKRLEGEVYYGILARDYYRYPLRCEFFYSSKPVEPTVRINPKNTPFSPHDEYIIPVNKSYDGKLAAMKKVARDFIAKYEAEKEGIT
jgi:hypothetical protein